MTTYETRYKAQKARDNSNDKIIKVCGGYVIMSAAQYRIWKNQK